MGDADDLLARCSRRSVLEVAAGLVGLAALSGMGAARATAQEARSSTALRFFGPDEARTVDAIVAQIIPTDETPGAREMGVLRFIDHGLAGFLSPLAAPFRIGLADFEARWRAARADGTVFASVSSGQQVEWLRQVERTPFFESIQQLTVLGALSMPEYGGNRNHFGWQLIGFADQHGFAPPFGYYDRDYPGFGAAENAS